jgi:hypothetical protein
VKRGCQNVRGTDRAFVLRFRQGAGAKVIEHVGDLCNDLPSKTPPWTSPLSENDEGFS